MRIDPKQNVLSPATSCPQARLDVDDEGHHPGDAWDEAERLLNPTTPHSIHDVVPSEHLHAANALAPLTLRIVGDVIAASLRGALPAGPFDVDVESLIEAIGEARVILRVPMREGRHHFRGVRFDVPSGAIATLLIRIKDGKLVAVEGESNDADGSRLDIAPPLRLPLWVRCHGAYLHESGTIRADLGAAPDFPWIELASLDPAELWRAFAQGRRASRTRRGLLSVIDVERLTIDATMSFSGEPMKIGSMHIVIASGGRLSAEINLADRTGRGALTLDGVQLRSGGLVVDLKEAHASLRAEPIDHPEGTHYRVALDEVDLILQKGTWSEARHGHAGGPANVDVGPIHFSDAGVAGEVRLVSVDGRKRLAWGRADLRAHLRGRLGVLSATSADPRASGRWRVESSHIEGDVKLGGGGPRVVGRLEDVVVGVENLGVVRGGASVEELALLIEGSGHLAHDSEAGGPEFALDAHTIRGDLRAYRGASARTAVHVVDTTLEGQGLLSISRRGVRFHGKTRVRGGVDRLEVHRPVGHPPIIVDKGARFDVDLTRLAVGGTGPFELDAQGFLDVTFVEHLMSRPLIGAIGRAHLSGTTSLSIRGGRVHAHHADAWLDAELGALRLGRSDGSTFVEALPGARLQARLVELLRSVKPHERLLRFGEGSSLDVPVAKGFLSFGGRRFELVRPSVLRVDADKLLVHGGIAADAGGKIRLVTRDVRSEVETTLHVSRVIVDEDGDVAIEDAHLDAIAAPSGTARPGADVLQTAEALSRHVVTGAAEAQRSLGLLKLFRDGFVTFRVPVEGALGEGAVHFDHGTTLIVVLTVAGGKVVQGETRARFASAGDAALRTSVRGVYLDEERSLRIDAVGGPDVRLAGFERLPDELIPMVERFAELGRNAANQDIEAGGSAFRFDRVQFDVEDGTLDSGIILLPGGEARIGGGRLTASGDGSVARLEGEVRIERLTLAQDGVAYDAEEGSARMHFEHRCTGGCGIVRMSFSELFLRARTMSFEHGQALSVALSDGRIANATLEVVCRVVLDAAARPAHFVATELHLHVPRLSAVRSERRAA